MFDLNASIFPGCSLTAEDRRGGRLRITEPRGVPPDIVLTDDQEHALEAMLAFEKRGTGCFVLQGAAGTGKTTVLQHYLRESSRSAVLTAPTNKAVRVLREMAGEHGIAVPCCTVHKLLGLVLQNDTEDRYCERVVDTLPSFDVLIVDECSMVGNKPVRASGGEVPGLYSQLRGQIAKWEREFSREIKVIYVGDPCQLPPVKEGALSETFNAGEGVFLSRVVRQALDNPIIRIATWIRSKMEKGEETPQPELSDDGFTGVHAMKDKREFRDLIMMAYEDEPDHPTRYKALAFRNVVVDSLNDQVRRNRYGKEAPRWVEGERYVATQPVVEWLKGIDPDTGRRTSKAKIWASTDEDAVLVEVVDKNALVPDFERYGAWLIKMEGLDGQFPAIVPSPKDEPRWKADLEDYGRRARLPRNKAGSIPWKSFWALHDAFAHFKPHYAMTCHRSQGSTYENVFVDVPDVLSNPSGFWEAIRCLYTACTRASKMLYLYEG